MTSQSPPAQPATSRADVLEVLDTRTQRTYTLPIVEQAVRAAELRGMRADDDDLHGIVSFDPALVNTAVCRSAITFIDGDRGVLRYRGYPIEELAGNLPFLDVAWLLINGELPDETQSATWAADVADARGLPGEVVRLVETFPPDAHPMAVLLSAWSALAAYRADSRAVGDPAARQREVPRFLAAIAELAALVFRHRTDRPVAAPRTEGAYAGRLLAGMFPERAPDPVLVDAIDVLLVLQADHEQNCSTNAVRAVGSSRVDPYSATAAGIAALFGPLHGGANEAVVRMLHEIGEGNARDYIDRVKRGERRLMGFGHRVYKSYDPRARLIRETTRRVFEVTGTNPLLDVALEVERVALSDDYFIDRKLYPNVDFYSGLIYEAMGLPVDTYTTLFAVARMAGWIAQWLEMIQDPDQKITRPRQIYVGPAPRSVP